jgi:pyruvate dehydrogenase E2 component (dihydrolipoamide acetyltransferase)
MTSRKFYLPDLGEGLQEAEIVTWHVRPGDRVVENQPLVSVETDKAVVDIPSPRSGRIEALMGNPGDRVSVGALLVTFDEGDEVDTGTVAGSLPGADAARTAPGAKAGKRDISPERVRAIPAARQLATTLDLELEKITATGPGGIVTLEDVQRAAGTCGDEWQTLHGLRRSMAENMARAGREAVPATVTGWADAGAWFGRHPPLLRLVLGVLHACAEEPALNCHFDPAKMARRPHGQVHLGIATETGDGLLVPVLHNAGDQPAQDIQSLLGLLKQQAEDRTLPTDQLRGATITLSNFGAVGAEHAAMVVLPPQVAIVGAGRIGRRPWVVEDHVEARPVVPLSITVDHRAVTGAEATRFMNALIEHLQLPDY